MSDIVWVDPPHSGSGGAGSPRVWEGRLAPLKARPGDWACLGRMCSENASKIKRGLFAGVSEGEFEAVTRDFDKATRTSTVYVRYVGSGDAGASSVPTGQVGQ